MSSYLQVLLEQQGSVALLLSLLLPSLLLFFISKWFFTSSPILKSPLRKNPPPPSPPQLPIMGNLHQLGSLPHRSLRSLARRHGPLMLLRFGRVPVLVASSPSAARDILKTHDLAFSTRPKLSITQKLFYGARDVSSAPYGEYWREMRSISVLHLLSNRRVGSFRAVRREETALLVRKIEAAAGTAVDLSQLLMCLTFDVACRAAMGRKYEEGVEGQRFREKLKEFGLLLGFLNVAEFIPWLAWVNIISGYNSRVERLVKVLDSLLDGVVQEHVNLRERNEGCNGGDSEDQKDFVDILLDIGRDSVTGSHIERESIKAVILDAFAGGTDTTFALLEWAMTQLLRHPKIMKKLQDEVRGISGPDNAITEEDLQSMPYLKAVIKETLRLYPPVPLLVPRESTQDVQVLGHDVAAGTMTIVNAWAVGRDPEAWPDSPEEFSPERFLNSSVDYKGQDFGLIPFGAGRRGCPGIAFSVTTAELVLATLVGRFDWGLPEGRRWEDMDVSETSGAAMCRKTPLLAVATPWA